MNAQSHFHMLYIDGVFDQYGLFHPLRELQLGGDVDHHRHQRLLDKWYPIGYHLHVKTIEEKIAESLRGARNQAKLSLRQLAARASTSHATLLAYEKGRKVPSTSTYFRVLEACGNTADILLQPRIREKDGIPRGDELSAVLHLAEQFPQRASRHLQLPRFPFNG